MFSASALPDGWLKAGFQEGPGWQPAIILASKRSGQTAPGLVEPWTALIPRPIPLLTERHIRPARIAALEECLDLSNRMRGEDLSIGLSQAGRPVEAARIESPQSLLDGSQAAILSCSPITGEHRFDGRYDPCLLLDFDQVETAYAEIEIEGEAGAILEIGYAERLTNGHFN